MIHFIIYNFNFIDSEKIIKNQQQIINQTLGLEIIGSDIITSDDIMILSAPCKTNLKVNNNYIFKLLFLLFIQSKLELLNPSNLL